MPCTVLVSGACGRPPLCSHSFDTAGGVDFRLLRRLPDPAPPARRPVLRWDEHAIPRDEGVEIGSIPQTVEATLGYWEAASGIANDVGLMMAESTCSSIFQAKLVGPDGGQALLCYQELTRIALERCHTSREAVELMGALAVEYGFAGNVGSGLGGSAETLAVVDSTEAWVFHVLPDDSGEKPKPQPLIPNSSLLLNREVSHLGCPTGPGGPRCSHCKYVYYSSSGPL